MQRFFAKHNIAPQKIAVAVSGGADSLALVFMAKEQLTVFGYEIAALTVNHNLRPASQAEAKYVAQLMRQNNIEHHILHWNSPKLQTGIETAARKARYDLLESWCVENGVKILLTAHHLQDQAETFLMRLERGSGLDGLCCMREISSYGKIQIARPLLNICPQELRQYLQNRNLKWVEDESNSDTRFLRNKIRDFLPLLEQKTGISATDLAQTAARLQSAQEYLAAQTSQIFADKVCNLFDVVFYFPRSIYLKWHREIKFRILSLLCKKEYPPRAESVLSAVAALDSLPFNGLTLGGKEIFCANGKIWIVPELTAKRLPTRKLWKKFTEQNPQYKNAKIPHKARFAILQEVGFSNDI